MAVAYIAMATVLGGTAAFVLVPPGRAEATDDLSGAGLRADEERFEAAGATPRTGSAAHAIDTPSNCIRVIPA